MIIKKKGKYLRAYCTVENEGGTQFKVDDEMGYISLTTKKFVGATVCLMELTKESEKQELKKFRAKAELKIEILKLMNSFKSKEEPEVGMYEVA